MGSSNETSFYGPVINPWKGNNNEQNLVPGGSSGGSSASFAANISLGPFWNRSGGSIGNQLHLLVL
ncbi:MAG: hypothetical protein CM15mP29_0790 [Alphaproteobacteria bacterium]|nr:MAG: hypothetical protein CM15mP29_0790 [Alphaproteobacteria bacterium]